MSNKYSLLGFLLILLSCNVSRPLKFNPNNKYFHYSGRIETFPNGSKALISSAASVEFNVKGEKLDLLIQPEGYIQNYFVLTVNDIYQKRYKIQGDSIHNIEILLPKNETNKVGIFKATEASSGNLIFYGIEANDLLPYSSSLFKIEFIGDSITCAALSDSTDVACDTGDYIDNHNAYLSYASQVALELNAKYSLSSVSGIGMYRNWNDENIEEPIMPQVYGNLYLNMDYSKPNNFSNPPDLVSICLGTNDLSGGDGIKTRLPFNSEKFTINYINFIETIYGYYPNTKIVLLNSPMKVGEQNNILVSCLEKVKNNFKDKDIAIFEFDKSFSNGCRNHPSVEDHKEMANQLTPLIKTLLYE